MTLIHKTKELTVIGIDPGSRLCGYGIVKSDGMRYFYIGSGRIELGETNPLHIRLKELYQGLSEVMEEYKPDEAAIEKVFFAKSAKSALSLGQARGVAVFTAAHNGLEVHEYSALEVKKAVTGYGRAEKSQVAQMVKNILHINFDLSPDSADALAIALCRLTRLGLENALERSIAKAGGLR